MDLLYSSVEDPKAILLALNVLANYVEWHSVPTQKDEPNVASAPFSPSLVWCVEFILLLCLKGIFSLYFDGSDVGLDYSRCVLSDRHLW